MTRPIDRTAIDRLAVEHLPMAMRMAMRLSGNADAAEDVVQETLCRVLRQWQTFRGEASFRTWMLRILINVERDRRRRHQHEPFEENRQAITQSEPVVEAVMAAELHTQVRSAIEQLPDRQREVALLHWGEGLAAREIAVILDITEANVYATVHIVRGRIAQALGIDHARSKRT